LAEVRTCAQFTVVPRQKDEFSTGVPAGPGCLAWSSQVIGLDLVSANDKFGETLNPLKSALTKTVNSSRAAKAGGFTLLELLVVIGVLAVLVAVQVPVLAAGKGRSRIAICASHVRQLALSCQIYANEYNDRLPLLSGGGAVWAWDFPASAANALLKYGAQTNTFYCPGTEPRFTDTQNWAGPGNTLWGFSTSFHITGYSFAFSGQDSRLALTNQNATIQPAAIANFPSPGVTTIYRPSERVLVADAILGTGNIQPGYVHPENNYTSISGGYTYNGLT
jgi:prepilin-type N-terminal cleavage/methylation domain-containing protein